MSSRHEFFIMRIRELGLYDQDSDYEGMIGKAVEELSEVFSRQGHSGMSANITTEIFTKLMAEWNYSETHIKHVEQPTTGEKIEKQ